MNPDLIASLTLRDIITLFVEGDTPAPPELAEWIDCARRYHARHPPNERPPDGTASHVAVGVLGPRLMQATETGIQALRQLQAEIPAMLAKVATMAKQGRPEEDAEQVIRETMGRHLGVFERAMRWACQ